MVRVLAQEGQTGLAVSWGRRGGAGRGGGVTEEHPFSFCEVGSGMEGRKVLVVWGEMLPRLKEKEKKIKIFDCIRRESNPRLVDGNDEFYH